MRKMRSGERGRAWFKLASCSCGTWLMDMGEGGGRGVVQGKSCHPLAEDPLY